MRDPVDLHAYQVKAGAHLLSHPQAMLWLDMGLGKTVVTLGAIVERMDRMQVYGTLVVAPKRVIQSVWRQEAKNWTHTQHLRFNLVHGAADYRTRAALTPADVYLVNYENLRWLADLWTHHYLTKGKYPPVNMVVLDEITKVKNSTSIRAESLERLLPFIPFRVGLTGTPASNGYEDLFGQFKMIDGGARLGTSKTAFRDRFFRPSNPMALHSKREPVKGATAVIEELVRDITLQMSSADYLELPEVVSNVIEIQLSPTLQAKYDTLEKQMWVELDSGHQINSFNAAALTVRCLQFAQGAMYLTPGSKIWERVHDEKLDALGEVVDEAQGKPVLVAVAFQHDAQRILKKYPNWRWVDSSMSETRFNETLDLWVSGQLPGLVAHPASMGHGIDRLKQGPVDDLVWYGHTWNLDHYEQMIARLMRQGRERPIRMHHLVALSTVEVAQRMALAAKASTQDQLKDALNEYRRQKAA